MWIEVHGDRHVGFFRSLLFPTTGISVKKIDLTRLLRCVLGRINKSCLCGSNYDTVYEHPLRTLLELCGFFVVDKGTVTWTTMFNTD